MLLALLRNFFITILESPFLILILFILKPARAKLITHTNFNIVFKKYTHFSATTDFIIIQITSPNRRLYRYTLNKQAGAFHCRELCAERKRREENAKSRNRSFAFFRILLSLEKIFIFFQKGYCIWGHVPKVPCVLRVPNVP
jgi:hypothetical protein